MSRFVFLNILMLLLVSSAFGEVSHTRVSTPNGDNEITLKLGEIVRPKKAKLSLNLENSQYVSSSQSYFRQGAAPENTTVGFSLLDDRKLNSHFSTRIDLRDDYSTEEKWNYFKPKDAYIAWKSETFGNGTLGRKYVTWSAWEETWQQGLFQPRYAENKMHPTTVGLTGWFGEFSMGKWQGTFAFLPINIPDTGPHYTVADDQFVSRNPWFHPPPSKFSLAGGTQLGDIRYSVKANVKEIVMNPGMALKIEQNFRGYDTRVSFAYKPMPQMLLGFPSYDHLVLGNGDDYMKIDVAPRVVYQKVISTDVHSHSGAWDWTVSSIYEDPDRDASSVVYTAQQVQSAFILGVSAAHPIGLAGPNAPEFTLAAFKLWGGDAPDRGYFAGDSTFFERRFQYIEAYAVGLKDHFYNWGKLINAEGRLIYDSQQNGGAISFLSGIQLDNNWRANASIDFLGLINTGGNIRDGFLNTYRANDRFALGMTYVY